MPLSAYDDLQIDHIIANYISSNYPIVRFPQTDNSQIFSKHIAGIIKISELQSQPVLFLCSEPGPWPSYLISGCYFENKLLFINPLGISTNNSFLPVIKSIKSDLKLTHKLPIPDFFLSEVQLKCRENNLVNCDPITIEVVKALSSLSQDTFVQDLFRPNKVITKKFPQENGLPDESIEYYSWKRAELLCNVNNKLLNILNLASLPDTPDHMQALMTEQIQATSGATADRDDPAQMLLTHWIIDGTEPSLYRSNRKNSPTGFFPSPVETTHLLGDDAPVSGDCCSPCTIL